MLGVIYCATNIVNGKIYVGQTVESLSDRKCKHRNDAESGKDCYFGRALRKYKLNGFIWEILCSIEVSTCSLLKEYLNISEQIFITEHDSMDRNKGYNSTSGGAGSIGFKHSEVSKLKMSRSHKGLKHTEATKEKIRKGHKGKPKHSIESRHRMSVAKMGKENPMFGMSFSEEHRRRLSESGKGKIVSMETRRRQSESMKKAWARRKS